MPAQMDEAGVKAAAQAIVDELGASSIKDMGKVMAVMKERYAGQMDFARASAVVKEILSAQPNEHPVQSFRRPGSRSKRRPPPPPGF